MLTRRNRWIVGTFLTAVVVYTASFAALSRRHVVETYMGGPVHWTFCEPDQGYGGCMILYSSSNPATEKWLARLYHPLILADAFVFERQHLMGMLQM